MKTIRPLIIALALYSCGTPRPLGDMPISEGELTSRAKQVAELKNTLAEKEIKIYSLEEALSASQELYARNHDKMLALASLHPTASTAGDTIRTISYREVTRNVFDTVPQILWPNVVSGNVALYCPPVMYYKETSDVFGFISELISDELIRARMIERIREQEGEVPGGMLNDNGFLIKRIQFYNLIELRLDDSDNEGFVIKRIHETDRQRVEPRMEGWHWKVTPTSEESKQQLVLKVIILKDDGSQDTSFSKTYRIRVRVKACRFFQNTKMLIVNNPQWAFGSLILPLITFLYGRYQAGRKKGKRTRGT